MRTLAVASTLILLAACSKAAEAPAAADSAAAIAHSPASDGSAKDAAAGAASATRAAISVPLLAYRYAYALEAPSGAIRGLVERHEAACQQAGPTVCQLVGAQVTEQGKDRLHGELAVRATAAWVARFRGGLEADLKNAGGRVVKADLASEDLSRQIVDTEAAIRARITLRDRLQNLLATRTGKLSDLLELEQQLARVQGEIDATQSELAVMRTRVAMSEVKLSYESVGVLAPQGVFSPVGAAVRDISGIFAMTLAVVIRMVAILGPWALIAGGLFWLSRRRARRPSRPQPTTLA